MIRLKQATKVLFLAYLYLLICLISCGKQNRINKNKVWLTGYEQFQVNCAACHHDRKELGFLKKDKNRADQLVLILSSENHNDLETDALNFEAIIAYIIQEKPL